MIFKKEQPRLSVLSYASANRRHVKLNIRKRSASHLHGNSAKRLGRQELVQSCGDDEGCSCDGQDPFFPLSLQHCLPCSWACCDLPFQRQLFVYEILASSGWQTAGELLNWVNEGIGAHFFGFYCLKLIKI